jgi:hypothetical protein
MTPSQETDKPRDKRKTSREDRKKTSIKKLKSVMFYVVIGGEIFIPLMFLIGLKLTGESWFVLIVCQGLMVVLTTGLLVGLIIDLVLESFRD